MDQLQQGLIDLFCMLTVEKQTAVVIVGHSGDRRFPGHGKQRKICFVAECEQLFCDMFRPDVFAGVQDQSTAVFGKQTSDQMV